MSELAQRYYQVCEEIAARCQLLNRPNPVLALVSKKQSLEKIREAYALGHRDFAENYVQEWQQKAQQLQDLDIRWHFIGQLQSNKLKQVVGQVYCIQSVDREKLLRELQTLAKDRQVRQKILLQIDWQQQEARGGASEQEVRAWLDQTELYPNLEFCGLMTVAPLDEEAGEVFAKTEALFHEMQLKLGSGFAMLSMGMSGDFEQALVHSANLLRIGAKIMGERS